MSLSAKLANSWTPEAKAVDTSNKTIKLHVNSMYIFYIHLTKIGNKLIPQKEVDNDPANGPKRKLGCTCAQTTGTV